MNIDNFSIKTKVFLITFCILTFISLTYFFVFSRLFMQVKNDVFNDYKALIQIEHQINYLNQHHTHRIESEFNALLQLTNHYQKLVINNDDLEDERAEFDVANNIVKFSVQYVKTSKKSNNNLSNTEKKRLKNKVERFKLQLANSINNAFDIIEQKADENLHKLFYFEVLSTVIFFVVTLFLVMYGINLIIKPLVLLRAKIEIFQGKVIQNEIKGDEVKLLVKSFLEMRTEIEDKQKQLNTALQQAKQANIAKSAFLANISHELRTPMLGILGFAELGIKKFESADKDKLYKYFDRIYISGSRLLLLLNNLLDLSKLEADKMEFDFHRYPIDKVLEDVLIELSSLISSASVDIKKEYIGRHFEADIDKTQIHQLIYNLLSNAIKYSPKGGIITINLMEESNNTVKMMISDQGIGIPEDECQSIFTKFTQSSKTCSAAGGTGLGLSICKEICKAHHASIWAGNIATPAHGAYFAFVLPKSQLT
ncbi:HAMP domain-containing sensor histidine kinase [Psychromonas hadalis]|uniref:HAMP domain-containing sensor histidine kinase n=1 Tax=Psychromonas hadalis TaxID=211669 RepID=UPI0003B58AA5|nr:HAMP domain-containing sensor histidine kinase [Psychromonas hadalis]